MSRQACSNTRCSFSLSLFAKRVVHYRLLLSSLLRNLHTYIVARYPTVLAYFITRAFAADDCKHVIARAPRMRNQCNEFSHFPCAFYPIRHGCKLWKTRCYKLFSRNPQVIIFSRLQRFIYRLRDFSIKQRDIHGLNACFKQSDLL